MYSDEYLASMSDHFDWVRWGLAVHRLWLPECYLYSVIVCLDNITTSDILLEISAYILYRQI